MQLMLQISKTGTKRRLNTAKCISYKIILFLKFHTKSYSPFVDSSTACIYHPQVKQGKIHHIFFR